MLLTSERKQAIAEKTIRAFLRAVINRPGVVELANYLENSGFYASPASTKYHGAFNGGLAFHSAGVASRFAMFVENLKLDIPASTVVITSVCHDLCKVGLYYTEHGEIKKHATDNLHGT